MKKSLIIANIVIVSMLVILAGLGFANAKVINVQADNRVIYSGNSEKNNICFMVNVYSGNEYLIDMLDIFDVYNVKTTFFIGGCWATNNIELVKEIYTRGHEIANHGFYHKDQDKLSVDENVQEIKMCHELIRKNLGIEMNLFAPPSGAYNKTTIDSAEALNYKTIMWTRDTIDWRDQDEHLIKNRALKKLANGDLILMHPTKKTVEALTEILSTAINSGFNPTTVTNCIN